MRYVLIGLGNIGKKRLAVLGDRCVATVDPYNKDADFSNIQEVDVEAYDAVILSVPDKVKIELINQCFKIKKHVLVEKPLIFSDDKMAQELRSTALENGVVWYTSYNHRFEPLIKEVKQELDSGKLGKVYHGQLFYGNGTVADLAGAWRENGAGVLEDLGCHLLDLISYLVGGLGSEVEPWSLAKREAKTLDHCIMATKDRRFVMEMSYLSWKNNCKIELYCENGSIHLNGLCKWGPSELTVYERVRPSGIPLKKRHELLTGPDITWKEDLKFFERQIRLGKSSFENDLWISKALQSVMHKISDSS